MTVRIELVGDGRDRLGESPVWDAATSTQLVPPSAALGWMRYS